MSKWLSRALAESEKQARVPLVPLVPKQRDIGANGPIGTNGTATESWCDAFEERAAIREFEGGFPRQEAERLALSELRAQNPRAPR